MLPVFNLWRITPRYWENRFCTSQEPTVWKTDASYNLFVSFAAARARRRGALRDSGPSGCERDNWQLMYFTRLLTIRKIVYRRKGDIQPVFRDTWNYCHPFLYFHSIFISITYRLWKTTLLFPVCLFLIQFDRENWRSLLTGSSLHWIMDRDASFFFSSGFSNKF